LHVLQDISQSLGFFDRRTIEQMLTRLCSRVPPRHLADLHPVTVMETIGKMRRQRYFILQHYRQMLQEQNLSDERLDWIHMDDIGKFANVDESTFWKTQDDIDNHLNEFQANKVKKTSSSPTKSRKKVYKNVGPDGLPKRGRPRKPESEKARKGRKKTSTKPPNETKKAPPKRTLRERGLQEGSAEETDEIESDIEGDDSDPIDSPPRKKPKGNPSRSTNPISSVARTGQAIRGPDGRSGTSQGDRLKELPETSRASVSVPTVATQEPVSISP
jgi:oxalate---CoA ligase